MARYGRLILMVAVTLAMVIPSPAAAASAPLLNWGQIVPTFHPGLDPSSSNVCVAGKDKCVESVIRSMSRDLAKLARSCDHNAIFQLGYLRTTEAYYESSQIPGFYRDVPWMHHYDATFAEYYIGPQRAWDKGRVDEVPPAWREAFGSADAQELTSIGNFLMGMNAHINRDLPFVLRDIGLTAPDGSSRKADHEKVNEFLSHVGDDLSPEMVARFDPQWDTNPDDDALTGFAVQQVIQEWRERAWNSAWLMAYAPAPVPDLVAQGIEAGSAQLAAIIRESQQATDAQRQVRNDWCAEHGRDWDGGDGVFFDGQDNPAYDAPSLSAVNPTVTIDQLAQLGVRVDVSLEHGVSVTLVPVPTVTSVTANPVAATTTILSTGLGTLG